MRKLFASLVMFLLISSAALAAEPFKWTNVGGDPCNPKAGCDLSWALRKTGWPTEVKEGLVMKVKNTSPESIVITSGLAGAKDPAWRGWMTWGQYRPTFNADVIAAWPDGQYHPASHWTFVFGDTVYHLIKVRKCGNWGGWKTVLVKDNRAIESPAPTAAALPGEPSDVIPIANCL